MASGRPDLRPAALALCGVAKSFGEHRVLEGIDFALAEGECAAIVGFSGSGKTTLIQLLGGLLAPDAGRVEVDGRPAGPPGPERGIVFQSYALLPWLSALANVELAVGAVARGLSRAERRERALAFLRTVRLDAARDKLPHELSGGMRQRVALARTLALDPRILLLDEPLGALDSLTRGGLQRELARILESGGKSAVLVTNDVDEAILLADRIVPLTPGPGATLGPSFRVALPRPRDRAAVNRDPGFKKLRNEVTAYLLELARRRGADTSVRTALPPLRPIRIGR
ncbi:MAG TPA: ABC transporter ATP-binding protein [Myxococcota bacterium]|nr:ABC transporter ATP-binding protein [Myxococcota bacterium]